MAGELTVDRPKEIERKVTEVTIWADGWSVFYQSLPTCVN